MPLFPFQSTYILWQNWSSCLFLQAIIAVFPFSLNSFTQYLVFNNFADAFIHWLLTVLFFLVNFIHLAARNWHALILSAVTPLYFFPLFARASSHPKLWWWSFSWFHRLTYLSIPISLMFSSCLKAWLVIYN